MIDLIQQSQQRFNTLLKNYISDLDCSSPKLKEALQTCLNNEGKRLRPLLVYTTGLSLGASLIDLDCPALAVELIHTYSLIHDDLPSMDNADMRRNQPSCHKAYGEACAILAGDGLQALAFEVLTAYPTDLNPAQRLSMVKILAQASGIKGMVGGQMLDMSAPSTLASVLEMYAMKTGALMKASIQLGALTASETILSTLETLANNLGLAFQIQDDLFDIESTEEAMGKPKGLDIENKKNTIPHLIGVDKAKAQVDTLFKEAFLILDLLGDKAKFFKELVQYIQIRKK